MKPHNSHHLKEKNGLEDTKLKNPDFRRAQATLIVERRLKGIPLKTIAKEFNLSKQTVSDRIKLAEQEGILNDIKDRVFKELMGPAVDALHSALMEGNVDAAKAVLFGTGVLLKSPKAPSQTFEMTLTQYREGKLAPEGEKEFIDADPLQAGDLERELPGDLSPRGESEGDD